MTLRNVPLVCLVVRPATHAVDAFLPLRNADHGFRFVEISGLPYPPALEDVTGRFVHTDVDVRATLSTGSDMMNKIHHNIVYGARANLVGYPSDCDQRDERQARGK